MATALIFFIVRLAPGDPVERILGPEASSVEVEQYRTQLGLDLPVWQQFADYLKGIVTFDMGQSLFSSDDVLDLMIRHLPPTMQLALIAIFISTLIGSFVGIFVATRKSSLTDNAVRVVSLIFLAFPIFSLAPLLVLLFAIRLQWFPVSEWISWSHMVLPIMTLVLPLSAILIRVSRNKFLEERNAPWVTVLYAKGLSSSAVWARIAKVCFPTILNVVAIQLSVVLAGTMITETIFDIPGIGTLLFDSIQNRDYPIVQAAIIYSTAIYMFIYFIVDYVNEFLDPRLKNSEGK